MRRRIRSFDSQHEESKEHATPRHARARGLFGSAIVRRPLPRSPSPPAGAAARSSHGVVRPDPATRISAPPLTHGAAITQHSELRLTRLDCSHVRAACRTASTQSISPTDLPPLARGGSLHGISHGQPNIHNQAITWAAPPRLSCRSTPKSAWGWA